jgi:tyrosine-specific transport protein
MVVFFGDGLSIENRKGLPRLGLTALVFIPPAVFAHYNPGVFISAIGLAGGIGEAVLNGFLPIAMVWVGRYKMKLEGRPMLFGGRGLLLLLALFCLFVVCIEVYSLIP